MKLLILGGTLFLGRHIAEEALRRGHAVTLFTRGQTNPELFPNAEKLIGDRKTDLSALAGRRWDAVIDTCGYVPRVVGAAADALRDAVDHYTFISSISAYAELNSPGVREDAPLGLLQAPTEEITGESYGPLKALCEAEVQRVFGERALIVRPGLLVGPFDPSNRFTYWVERIAAGGDIAAPGNPDAQVQIIDARDAARWLVGCAEARVSGVFNMTGPDGVLTMKEMLDAARDGLNPSAHFVWMSESFLLEQKVAPWTEMPLWLPADDGGVMSVDIRRALDKALAFRPLEEIIRDTHAWQQQANARLAEDGAAPAKPKAGMEPDRERALLSAWRAAGSGAGAV